jgi:ATP-binding cassette, subfamily B, multidrug efflux pump
VIRRPAIYLFDDAFSALDLYTDAKVRAALREISGNATIIIVAQRISTVTQADQVIVIDDGQIVGTGTHESLLANCPTYFEFADSQSLGVEVMGWQ